VLSRVEFSVSISDIEARLTHIGGPTVLIVAGGWRLLTDPTFDPPGQDYRFGWGTGSRKLTGPAMLASELGRSTQCC
jgi:L-ascorbate metabolism protein UlaG (beta-lactamase superfamily)